MQVEWGIGGYQGAAGGDRDKIAQKVISGGVRGKILEVATATGMPGRLISCEEQMS